MIVTIRQLIDCGEVAVETSMYDHLYPPTRKQSPCYCIPADYRFTTIHRSLYQSKLNPEILARYSIDPITERQGKDKARFDPLEKQKLKKDNGAKKKNPSIVNIQHIKLDQANNSESQRLRTGC